MDVHTTNYTLCAMESIIGEDDDSAECKYAELDNPSGRENEVLSSLEDMVEKILSDALSQ